MFKLNAARRIVSADAVDAYNLLLGRMKKLPYEKQAELFDIVRSASKKKLGLTDLHRASIQYLKEHPEFR